MKTQVQLIPQYQLLYQLALLMHWSMYIPIPSRGNQISFENTLILKEISMTEHECINMHSHN